MILILDNEIRSISKSYHEGTAQLISLEKDANKFSDQLGIKLPIPFKSDQKVKPIISRIPGTKISNRYSSGRKIYIIDSDAIIKPLEFLGL